jgi:hypothetical protein
MSDLITWDKYAKYLQEEQRRETWDEISERNMQMHIDNHPKLADQIV